MPKRLLIDLSAFPIQPKDINIDHEKGFTHLYGSFDHRQTEVSAYWVVKMCQKLGSWGPFTMEQIQELYHETNPDTNFCFERLVDPQSVPANQGREFGRIARHAASCGSSPIVAGLTYAMAAEAEPAEKVLRGGGWIVLHADGKYYVTDDFVSRCHKSSPARGSESKEVAVAS